VGFSLARGEGKFALAYDQAEHDHAHCAPPSALAS
jgi:hypothetical protein